MSKHIMSLKEFICCTKIYKFNPILIGYPMVKRNCWIVFILCLAIISTTGCQLVESQRAPADFKPLVDSNREHGAVGQRLQGSMIWMDVEEAIKDKEVFAGFRKHIELDWTPENVEANIFADSRYILWINGRYVDRGPCRFDPKGPQYDTLDITAYLKKGVNVVSVMVQGNVSNLKIMKHAPGLAVWIRGTETGGKKIDVVTDESWTCSREISYSPRADRMTWSCVMDIVDNHGGRGRWMEPDFDVSQWPHAVRISGDSWGMLTGRSIPLLRETNMGSGTVVLERKDGHVRTIGLPIEKGLPVELNGPCELIIDAGKLSLMYWTIDFDVENDTEIYFKPCQDVINNEAVIDYNCENIFRAGSGKSRYMSGDTFGFRYLSIRVAKGRAKIDRIKFVSRLYPDIKVADFQCSDDFLNRTWAQSSYSTVVMSEDGYVDSAERAEWMGDVGMIQYPASRKVICGPGEKKGQIIYSDPRLMRNMLRHTAESQMADGRLKAHHPSDRFDHHWYIEDYSCLWVNGLRSYYENTADKTFLREMWPALIRQMQWFTDHRNWTGLVTAREFLIHLDNPMRYQVCQGATLNAFIYMALKDSAVLAEYLGDADRAAEYKAAAAQLKKAYNTYLWDAGEGTFYAGVYFDEAGKVTADELKQIEPHHPDMGTTQWVEVGQKVTPTIQAALLAIRSGVVDQEHRDRVVDYLKKNYSQLENPYTHQFMFDVFYGFNSDQWDTEVLTVIRNRWEAMVNRKSPGTSTEAFHTQGYLCHPFGLVPAHFLGGYVLGVRKPEPVWNRRILIEPHLGDLAYAEGVSITELGPCKVKWVRENDSSLEFSFDVPKGVTAVVKLPAGSAKSRLDLNGKKVKATYDGRFLSFKVAGGHYSGRVINQP